MQTASATAPKTRPEVSVYWKPGCSSCLKTKEFVEENGIFYESVNVEDDTAGMQEVLDAGMRSIPVVRRGNKFVYAQSLDDVAELLEVTRNHTRLSQDELLARWEAIMSHALTIVPDFKQELLDKPAIVGRARTLLQLCSHVFQIPETFITMLKDPSIDAKTLSDKPRAEVVTKDQLLAYINKSFEDYKAWRAGGGGKTIPDRMLTYYGNQPSAQVLERGVWHSTQHSRQLDHIAAGRGAEMRIPVELYEGLPLPKRLWA